MNYSLMIMKPDVLERNVMGPVLTMVEEAGFKVRRLEIVQLSADQAREFYAVHADKPFIGELVEYMTSGPCAPLVVESENAIPRLRELLGATNPADATEGTIRARFGKDIQTNSVHGSDSPESVQKEIPFFFPDFKL
ncbi:MAG: nucleoside-diphosphate kinase [Candidatus Eisenbacteria bacterium]|uniref:Nucleoside diphosphate kinase n=1 Tax=Eiseniibacteriota bacterium TaxID=2212470 RepID=A0A7Y2E9P6_UNCEI|nr:nucleoside-diphosphate kinase [Candidatus Eisenbacteria bacterium]